MRWQQTQHIPIPKFILEILVVKWKLKTCEMQGRRSKRINKMTFLESSVWGSRHTVPLRPGSLGADSLEQNTDGEESWKCRDTSAPGGYILHEVAPAKRLCVVRPVRDLRRLQTTPLWVFERQGEVVAMEEMVRGNPTGLTTR